MKRLLSALLALTLVVASFALISCNGDDAKTTTTATTKATTTKATTTAPSGDNTPSDDDSDDQPFTDFKVGTASELVAAITKINNWDVALNSNITLTADIDMTGYTDPQAELAYDPIYDFQGIFDGAGHKISNLNWTFTMANDATTNVPSTSSMQTYIVDHFEGGIDGCFATLGVALLVSHLNNGGVVKNLTVENSSVSINCSYNKNYQTYTAGLVAVATNGIITDCTMKNVNVNVPALVNTNQGNVGYAAALVACGRESLVINKCSIDGGTVDTSTNLKFNASGILGVFPEAGTLTIADSLSTATLKVCTDFTDTSTIMYTANMAFGGETDPRCVKTMAEINETYTPAA